MSTWNWGREVGAPNKAEADGEVGEEEGSLLATLRGGRQ